MPSYVCGTRILTEEDDYDEFIWDTQGFRRGNIEKINSLSAQCIAEIKSLTYNRDISESDLINIYKKINYIIWEYK